MPKQEKTNVMRALERLKVPYQEHFYGGTEAISGVEVAAVLAEGLISRLTSIRI